VSRDCLAASSHPLQAHACAIGRAAKAAHDTRPDRALQLRRRCAPMSDQKGAQRGRGTTNVVSPANCRSGGRRSAWSHALCADKAAAQLVSLAPTIQPGTRQRSPAAPLIASRRPLKKKNPVAGLSWTQKSCQRPTGRGRPGTNTTGAVITREVRVLPSMRKIDGRLVAQRTTHEHPIDELALHRPGIAGIAGRPMRTDGAGRKAEVPPELIDPP